MSALAYDLADHLTKIDTSGSPTYTTFGLDALGRFASRTVNGVTDMYDYVDTSETVARITTGSTVTDSIVSPEGDRFGVKVGTTLNWFIPDLHGDVAGSWDATEATVVNAIRYDAWGQTLATGSAGGTAVGTGLWKYQGRLDVSPSGLATPLYDMSARFYSPGIGAFTSLDSVMGSAQDPLSMNRFLYAEGDPTTLIDPTGHSGCYPATMDPEELIPAGFCAAVAVVGGVIASPELAIAGVAVAATIVTAAAISEAGHAKRASLNPKDYPSGYPTPTFAPPPNPVEQVSVTPSGSVTVPKPQAAPPPTLAGRNEPPRLNLPDNDNYPLPPGGPCKSPKCSVEGTVLLALLSAALSGVSGHQRAEGDSEDSLREEIQEIRNRRGEAHPAAGPLRKTVPKAPTLSPGGSRQHVRPNPWTKMRRNQPRYGLPPAYRYGGPQIL